MKTFIQKGNIVTVTTAANIASGDGVLVGSIFGVAAADAAAGDEVEITTTGVFDLPKDAATVIDIGNRVAWDDTAKEIALPGVGLYPVGVATEAAGNGVATVKVRLDGISTVGV